MDFYGFESRNVSTASLYRPVGSSAIYTLFQPPMGEHQRASTADCGCGAREWDYDRRGVMRCGYCHSQPREVRR